MKNPGMEIAVKIAKGQRALARLAKIDQYSIHVYYHGLTLVPPKKARKIALAVKRPELEDLILMGVDEERCVIG